jgi:hypothetical protein
MAEEKMRIEMIRKPLLLNLSIMLLLDKHKTDISHLYPAHKVKHLYAFGSVLSDKFNKESDIIKQHVN